jgi:hypothetical protein
MVVTVKTLIINIKQYTPYFNGRGGGRGNGRGFGRSSSGGGNGRGLGRSINGNGNGRDVSKELNELAEKSVLAASKAVFVTKNPRPSAGRPAAAAVSRSKSRKTPALDSTTTRDFAMPATPQRHQSPWWTRGGGKTQKLGK